MRSNRLSLAVAPIVLSIIFLLANIIATPPAALRPRVFVIGLSKTGTTSIGDALGILGYRRLGWRDIRSRHMVHTWANGNNDPLLDLTRYYDAFEDLPWPALYREMAERYPDAKFILSRRRDDATWLRSMRRHVGRGRWLPYAYFYGADVFEGNEQVILESYRNHTMQVRDYFRNQPERLLEMSIDDDSVTNWHNLCQIAQCPGDIPPKISFPHANAASHWNTPAIVFHLHWLWGWAITRTEELTSFYYYRSRLSALKPILASFWHAIDVMEQACSEVYFVLVPLLSKHPLAQTTSTSKNTFVGLLRARAAML